MPTPGLSLVGFMARDQAINHLQTVCIPQDSDPVALETIWNAAKANLGSPVPRAGQPSIQPIPASHQAYVQQLLMQPWIAPALAGYAGLQVAMVEIDPLLAFQWTVCLDRGKHHCGQLSGPPTLDELFSLCLPATLPNEQFNLTPTPQSMMLTTRSLNVRLNAQGFFQNQNVIGVQFAVSLSLSHVVRFNGRYYLHNGFHRAVGARAAGATAIPCIVRDVSSPEELGLGPGTFDLPLLESGNPPTVGHFTNRAHAVQLRELSRVIHVSWSEYVVPRE